MANILAAVISVLTLLVIVGLIVRARSRPERKLLREFRKLRRMIVRDMKGEQRTRARKMLEDCEAYLDNLVQARQQQELLLGMAGTAKELTGRSVVSETEFAIDRFNQRISEDLNRFFASLARISAAANLHRDRAIDELAEFTEDLELQRDALYELTRELRGDAPARAALPVTLPEAAPFEEDEEETRQATSVHDRP